MIFLPFRLLNKTNVLPDNFAKIKRGIFTIALDNELVSGAQPNNARNH